MDAGDGGIDPPEADGGHGTEREERGGVEAETAPFCGDNLRRAGQRFAGVLASSTEQKAFLWAGPPKARN
jgi:hypothetical protein